MAGIDYVTLRRRLRLSQVLELTGFVATTRCGAQVRGRCPLHESYSPRSRSFAAHLERQCWQCFRCGAHGNALDLWMAATAQPLYEAALDRCESKQLLAFEATTLPCVKDPDLAEFDWPTARPPEHCEQTEPESKPEGGPPVELMSNWRT